MKTTILSIISVFALTISLNATRMSIPQAVSKGLISVTITYKHPGDHFYGKCMSLEIKSKSSAKVDLVLEAGRFIHPVDSGQQRMMVIEEMYASVMPYKTITMEAFGMCSQMHKSAPSNDIAMTMGSKAEGNLLALAQLISQNKYKSGAAQNAIWVFTDDNDLESIYCEDEKEMKTLVDFCAKATGKTIKKPFPKPVKNTATGQYTGKVEFEEMEKCSLSMYLYDSNNEKVVTFFENKELGKTNHFTISYEINYRQISAGIYYVRVYKNGTKMMYNKAVDIK